MSEQIQTIEGQLLQVIYNLKQQTKVTAQQSKQLKSMLIGGDERILAIPKEVTDINEIEEKLINLLQNTKARPTGIAVPSVKTGEDESSPLGALLLMKKKKQVMKLRQDVGGFAINPINEIEEEKN